MARVLYVLYDGICDPLGRSQVLPYLSGLSKLGHEITILSIEKPTEYAKHHDLVGKIAKENKLEWFHLDYSTSIPIVTPYLLTKKLKNKAVALHLEKNFDIVHCRSYMASLAGHLLQQKYGVKFIFDMRGFFADERVDGKVWNLSNPLFRAVYNFFKKKEIIFLQDADHIVSLTQNGKDVLLQRSDLALADSKITVIPCCVDNSHFNPSKVDTTKHAYYTSSLGLKKEQFVLSYLGSIGTWYMLDEMLDFFKVMLENKPDSVFLFISKSKELIEETCRKKGVSLNSIRVQPVPYDDVPSILSISDASLFFILPVFSKRASSPVKQGEIMAMGIPIICNSNIGDTDTIIEKYQCGEVITSFHKQEYQKVIDKLDTIKRLPRENGIKGAEEYFGLRVGIDRYATIYKALQEVN